ncbi:class F sortase [Saccharomonospora sp. NPDC006951]
MTVDTIRCPRGGRPRQTVAAALAGVVIVTLTSCDGGAAIPERRETGPAPAITATSTVDEDAAAPVRVRIPGIDVDAPIVPLDTDADGVLPPPPGNHLTGWWRAGPEPGERGPAVIAGHVDSYKGPAVFHRLAGLVPGRRVLVDREDGTTVTFTVTTLERHAKDRFPARSVYGETPGSELRLVTCGGEFDSSARRYLDNVIVYARRA